MYKSRKKLEAVVSIVPVSENSIKWRERYTYFTELTLDLQP